MLNGRRGASLIALIFFVAMQTASAQTTDVFGRTASGAPSAANTQGGANQNEPEHHFVMPEPVRRLVVASIELQSDLNEKLQGAIANQRNGTSQFALWMLVLLSFGYGVLHALGPGHGKLAASAYLMSHRARVGHAFALSVWSSSVQAISAICLVGGAAWLTREGLGGVLTRASSLDFVSYVALLAVGLVTIWSIATRRDCCDDVRITLVPKKRQQRLFATDGADVSDEADYLGTHLSANRRTRGWSAADPDQGSIWIARQIFMTGLAVGVRPCVGAIFVLIAALANGIFMTGVLAAFAMAAGVSLTVFAIGLASLGVNRVASSWSVARRQAFERIRVRFALIGAVFITVFAAWQVFALLIGWQVTTLT
jgi:nickel/cobalt exporter